MVVTKSALVGGYYLFWVSESQFPPYIRSTNVYKTPIVKQVEIFRSFCTFVQLQNSALPTHLGADLTLKNTLQTKHCRVGITVLV